MVKINKDAFAKLQESANMIQNSAQDSDDTLKRIPVYNIPKSWIDVLKKNRITASSYIKQAFFEKLNRDGFLNN